jgi:methyl-accepting chemotaxis protein
MTEQSVTAQDIASSTSRTSERVTEARQSVEQLAETAKFSTAAGVEMMATATELLREAQHLRGEVDAFLQTLRAA